MKDNKEIPSESQQHVAAAKAFQRFCVTVAALRDPEHGCPWDLKQDLKSLRPYLIEEAYEACEAMAGDDWAEVCGELGDVLLQVVLNAQIASESKGFSICDVLEAIDSKIKRRHPHVFGSEEDKQKKDIESIKDNWRKIKEQENFAKNGSEAFSKEQLGYFQEAKVRKIHPATSQAQRIGELAAQLKFDWDSPRKVLQVLKDELEEMQKAWEDPEELSRELGDVYFTLAQLCRHLGLHPEVVAQGGNDKFLRRFQCLEELARERGSDIKGLNQTALEALWQEAKAVSQPASSGQRPDAGV